MDDNNRPAQIEVTNGGTTDISLHKNGVEVHHNGDAPKKIDREGNAVTYYLKMVWGWRKIITVEPAFACWMIPTLILFIANENLQLEKSCRVNLGLEDIVCTKMIDPLFKADIDCGNLTEPVVQANSTAMLNTSIADLSVDQVLTATEFYQVAVKVCNAETESQKLSTIINGYRAPIAQIFPIIIILFAGGWSDIKGIRKPCILFPIIGETLGCLALFISAIFMRQLPMEFGAILEKVLPAMFGGHTLMFMGIYSYLTGVTTEENRTARFGGFAVFAMIVQIITLPFGGDLFHLLGYIKLFLLCLIIYAIGIIYTVFFLKEVRKIRKEKKILRLLVN